MKGRTKAPLSRKEKWAAKPWWQKLLLILLRCVGWLLVWAVVFACVMLLLMRVGIVDLSVMDDALIALGIVEKHHVEELDADEYFRNNGTVMEITDAATSEDVLTEVQVSTMLQERGFTEYPITCNYAMDGTFDADMEFTYNFLTKHPMYETYYITAAGELWTVFVINGDVMAKPVSYNLQSGLGTEVLLSESNTLTSYDSATNQFYETIPDDSVMIVKTVDRIDAQTLENLTGGGIDGL